MRRRWGSGQRSTHHGIYIYIYIPCSGTNEKKYEAEGRNDSFLLFGNRKRRKIPFQLERVNEKKRKGERTKRELSIVFADTTPILYKDTLDSPLIEIPIPFKVGEEEKSAESQGWPWWVGFTIGRAKKAILVGEISARRNACSVHREHRNGTVRCKCCTMVITTTALHHRRHRDQHQSDHHHHHHHCHPWLRHTIVHQRTSVCNRGYRHHHWRQASFHPTQRAGMAKSLLLPPRSAHE